MKNTTIKNIIQLIAILCLITTSFTPSVLSKPTTLPIEGKTLTVLTVDDDGDGDYTTIQAAIDNATPGDLIEVYSGTYPDENVTITKQIILQGIDTELGGGTGIGKPLIIGVIDSQQERGLITVQAENCTINGFHLKGKDNSFCRAGIGLLMGHNEISYNDIEQVNFGLFASLDASSNTIYQNTFPGTFYAIVTYSNDNEIYENTVTNNGYGIEISYPATQNKIYRNTILNSDDAGIKTSRSNLNEISENTVTGCLRGIVCYNEGDGNENTVSTNIVSHCGQGIWCAGSQHQLSHNQVTTCEEGIVYAGSFDTYAAIYGNTIESCTIGLSILSLLDSTIYNNTISFCETGLQTDNAYNCSVYNNSLLENCNGFILGGSTLNSLFLNTFTSNSEYGLLVKNSNENTIYHNNFITNHISVYQDCPLRYPWEDYNTWDLGYKTNGCGNYWSDYTGKDLNHDGIGDTSYIIPDVYPNPMTNDKDHFPLMTPGFIPTSLPPPFLRLFFIILEKLSELIQSLLL